MHGLERRVSGAFGRLTERRASANSNQSKFEIDSTREIEIDPTRVAWLIDPTRVNRSDPGCLVSRDARNRSDPGCLVSRDDCSDETRARHLWQLPRSAIESLVEPGLPPSNPRNRATGPAQPRNRTRATGPAQPDPGCRNRNRTWVALFAPVKRNRNPQSAIGPGLRFVTRVAVLGDLTRVATGPGLRRSAVLRDLTRVASQGGLPASRLAQCLGQVTLASSRLRRRTDHMRHRRRLQLGLLVIGVNWLLACGETASTREACVDYTRLTFEPALSLSEQWEVVLKGDGVDVTCRFPSDAASSAACDDAVASITTDGVDSEGEPDHVLGLQIDAAVSSTELLVKMNGNQLYAAPVDFDVTQHTCAEANAAHSASRATIDVFLGAGGSGGAK